MDIARYLEQNDVQFAVHEHPPAYTSQEAAAEQHISGDMVAKAVLVETPKGCAMCVLPASYKLDMSKAAKALGVKRVSLADEAKMAELFPDAEVGAEPPFGNLYDLPTVVDEHLAADQQIVCRAGTHSRSVQLKYADYARLVEPKVADISLRA